MQQLILIVEDEQPIVDILKFNLEKNDYRVIEALDGNEGLRLALSKNPDLVLLDVMLPGLDGFGVCRKIREKSSVPIIMLTARDEEVDKVLGLELGADDYMTKPFSVRELLARVKANLRRTSPETEEAGDVLRIGELIIDSSRYEVVKNDTVIALTLREFELVKFLAEHRGRIFSRERSLRKSGVMIITAIRARSTLRCAEYAKK